MISQTEHGSIERFLKNSIDPEKEMPWADHTELDKMSRETLMIASDRIREVKLCIQCLAQSLHRDSDADQIGIEAYRVSDDENAVCVTLSHKQIIVDNLGLFLKALELADHVSFDSMLSGQLQITVEYRRVYKAKPHFAS